MKAQLCGLLRNIAGRLVVSVDAVVCASVAVRYHMEQGFYCVVFRRGLAGVRVLLGDFKDLPDILK